MIDAKNRYIYLRLRVRDRGRPLKIQVAIEERIGHDDSVAMKGSYDIGARREILRSGTVAQAPEKHNR